MRLATCHRMAAAIDDWGTWADHRSYVSQLRRDHGRKHGFWSQVPKAILPEPEARTGPAPARADANVAAPTEPEAGDDGSIQPGLC